VKGRQRLETQSTSEETRVRQPTDFSVNSANPDRVAEELAPLDRKIGWLAVNRFTYPFLRLLAGLSRSEIDLPDVDIETSGLLGEGTILVSPKTRTGAGALILIHGGGYVMGSPLDVVPKAAFFASHLGVPIICPKYRLSPKARFPAALDDCHHAWSALLASAKQLSIDPGKIVVAGYSAGAGLAANLVHRLCDERATQPAAQMLVYPMLDDRTAAGRELDRPRHRVWSNRNNRFGWEAYLGHPVGEDCERYSVAARRNDLTGLPPTWIGVGTCDLFLDENREFAQRLANAKVDTTYVEVPGAIHGFDMAGTELGRAFSDSQANFVNRFTS
jgi:acetyl esterase/lipase